MAECMHVLDAQLAEGQARGGRFFFGDVLSALDVYWATFLGLIDPLPEELCPMASAFRPLYTNNHPILRAALSDHLRAHRDFIYRDFLELPVVF
jgi:glutathione S-transferase